MDFYAFRSAARTLPADDGANVSKAGENGDTARPRPSITRPATPTLTGLFSLAWENSAPGKRHRD